MIHCCKTNLGTNFDAATQHPSGSQGHSIHVDNAPPPHMLCTLFCNSWAAVAVAYVLMLGIRVVTANLHNRRLLKDTDLFAKTGHHCVITANL